jgi:NAD(P)-dependent dehydrogenase (short-subunit alcohol dehydrogenase family)
VGRLVLVTGGGRGIGRALVRRFAAAGDRVVAVGRDRDALARTASEAGGAVAVEVCDVVDEEAVGELVARVGAVDVLVNNAGVSTSAPLARTAVADWRRQLEVNATGAFLCTRGVLPGMLDRDRGRVVTVASTAGRAGFRYTAGYSASKHAAVGLMRAVAAEVAGTGVTANAVCPAFVRTEMSERSVARIVERTGRAPEEAEQALAEASPLGRLLEPEEVAAAVAYLASEEAGAVNGQALVLDGGGLQR